MIDGVPLTAVELSAAASMAWPQRLSALYGWMPLDQTKSYDESHAFLMSLQVGRPPLLPLYPLQ
jgi:hypothetical protein